MNDDPKQTAREAEIDASLAPILEGVHKIADSVVKAEKRMTEKIEEVQKGAARAVEDLEAKANKSYESVLSQIGRVKDMSMTLGRAMLDIRPGDDTLKELIPEETKKIMGLYEHVARSLPEKSTLKKPEVFALTAEWNAMVLRASCLRKWGAHAADYQREAARIRAGLQEFYIGPNWQAYEKAAYAEDADATGGYTIPTIQEAEVQRLMGDAGLIYPRCRQVALRSKITHFPSEATAVSVGWAEEGGTLTGTEGTFGQITLQAEKIYARATMSYEMLQDSSVGLLQWLLATFSEKMAREQDKQVVLGDASGPVITGIMNASGIVAVTSGTAAGRALSYALLVETYTAAGESTAIDQGVWMMSKRGYTQLLSLVDTTGQPIVKAIGTVEFAPAGTLFGRPIILHGALGGNLTLDDVTNTATKIVYGPLQKYLWGTRQGMSWDVTDAVNWAKYQVDARLTSRVAGNVGVPAAFSYLGQIAY